MASARALRKLSAQLDLTLQGRPVDLLGFFELSSVELRCELLELSKGEGRAAAKEKLQALRRGLAGLPTPLLLLCELIAEEVGARG